MIIWSIGHLKLGLAFSAARIRTRSSTTRAIAGENRSASKWSKGLAQRKGIHSGASDVVIFGETLRRILICRPNARLGNTLLLTPLVQEIERSCPWAEVDILTSCPAAPEIFRESLSVRNIYQAPHYAVRHPVAHVATLLNAHRTSYDLVIDPCPRSWSSRFATRLMKARIKLGFASAQKHGGVNLEIAEAGAPLHMGLYPVYLFRSAIRFSLAVAEHAPMPVPTIALTSIEKSRGRNKLKQIMKERKSTLTLAVALNATGDKRIEPEWWRELLENIAAQVNVRVIEILPASGVAFLPEYPGYFSTSIRRIAAVIQAADCFVSADSGLMHLGAATTTPTIGLFKRANAAVYAPYSHGGCGLCLDSHSTQSIAKEVVRRLSAHETLQPLAVKATSSPDEQK